MFTLHKTYAATLLISGLALLGSASRADAAMRTWKAFTVDNLWSNPTNWEEGAAPVDGDDLRFPGAGRGGPATVVNDIANLRVHTLVTTGNYTITGQPFTLLNSLFGSGAVIYDVHITMVGDQIWTLHGYQITPERRSDARWGLDQRLRHIRPRDAADSRRALRQRQS